MKPFGKYGLLAVFLLLFFPLHAEMSEGLAQAAVFLFYLILYSIYVITGLVLLILFINKRSHALRLTVQTLAVTTVMVFICLLFHPDKELPLGWYIGNVIYFGLHLFLGLYLKHKQEPDGTKKFNYWHLPFALMLGFIIFKGITIDYQRDKSKEKSMKRLREAEAEAGQLMEDAIIKSYKGAVKLNRDGRMRAFHNDDTLFIYYHGFWTNSEVNIIKRENTFHTRQDSLFWFNQFNVLTPLMNLEQLNNLIRAFKEHRIKIGTDIVNETKVYCMIDLDNNDNILRISYNPESKTIDYLMLRPWQLMPKNKTHGR